MPLGWLKCTTIWLLLKEEVIRWLSFRWWQWRIRMRRWRWKYFWCIQWRKWWWINLSCGMVIKDVVTVWQDVKEHVVFTKISFFNTFSIPMHFISFLFEKKLTKMKSWSFAKINFREIFEMASFAKICSCEISKIWSFAKISSREMPKISIPLR